jgi:metallo-beta-lactamase family protein
MKIRFLGAARTVTGSMHLIETNGSRVLLETGLFQGRRQEAYERNQSFPFDPKDITAVVLSHAHIDHSGNLPSLVRKGFGGHIYTTPATRDLAAVMLADGAHIQLKEAEFLSRKNRRFIPPLYGPEDAAATVSQMVSVPKHRKFRVCDGVDATFIESGHILGSGGVLLEVKENGRTRSIAFSGDVGHVGDPLLHRTRPIPGAQVLIMESTYGDKTHAPLEDRKEKLLEVVKRTAHRGGKLIVPAFSVGRTQTLVYTLQELFNEQRLPLIPIFVDSPLSVNATEVFRLHREEINAEALKRMESEPDPYGFASLTYIRKLEESMALNDRHGPCVIISASGMCEAGRVLHHLKNTVDDFRNTILIVGYMAEHTLGHKLLAGDKEVSILGKPYPVKAEVAKLNAFSAHADQPELIAFARACHGPGTLERIFLVHGDEFRITALKDALAKSGGLPAAEMPRMGEGFEID